MAENQQADPTLLNDAELSARLEALPAERVTEQSITARIERTEYFSIGPFMTLCVIHMCNGFEVVGYSRPASPENFDVQVGRTYAYKNAFNKLWQLEGYLLCEKLSSK